LEELEFIQKKQTESITSLARDINDLSDDSLSTKDSEDSLELKTKKLSISQKKSYKKAPQGKMDTYDEELLLSLASKYKHDWKKVSKKNFQAS